VTGSLIDLGTILGAGSGRIARFADDLPRLTDGE
jgi:hypothetical protein